MANEPISALTLFTTYSTADEVEILDVSDTTFASTGTNKRIPFSTLLTMAGVGSGTGGGSGTVTSVGLSLPTFITVTGSPVSTSGTLTGTLATQTAKTLFAGPTSGSAAAPTFRALVPADLPTGTYVNSVMSGAYPVTSSFANVGLSITLPAAGTYLLMGCARGGFSVTGSVGQNAYMAVQFYDSTNSKAVPNSQVLLIIGSLQVASTAIAFQQSSPIGPVTYTVTGSTVIQLQALYATTGTVTNPLVYSDNNGATSITATRIY